MMALFVTWGKQDYEWNISYEVELTPRGSLPLFFSECDSYFCLGFLLILVATFALLTVIFFVCNALLHSVVATRLFIIVM